MLKGVWGVYHHLGGVRRVDALWSMSHVTCEILSNQNRVKAIYDRQPNSLCTVRLIISIEL